MANRPHDWMFDRPLDLRYTGGKSYKLDPEAVRRRKRMNEVEHKRELKRLEKEVWDD